MMAYLDFLEESLCDEMVSQLVANNLEYDEQFRTLAESKGFDFCAMLTAAADQIPDEEIEDLW